MNLSQEVFVLTHVGNDVTQKVLKLVKVAIDRQVLVGCAAELEKVTAVLLVLFVVDGHGGCSWCFVVLLV
jgi:hypothetical protein